MISQYLDLEPKTNGGKETERALLSDVLQCR